MYRRVMNLTIVGLASCVMNQSGNIGATKTGDTSRPAERGSPIEALRAACGDGAPTTYGDTTLRRSPYLQQVTTESAIVGWVGSSANTHVELSKPDGSAIGSAPASVEPYALRSAGENQMWTNIAALEPDTIYCYDVADDTQSMTTRTGFRTAPRPDDPDPVRFLAFGDSGGGGSDQFALLDQMYTVPYDLMIHTGDIAYDSGTISEYEDNVFGVYADLFRNIPFFPASRIRIPALPVRPPPRPAL